MARRTSIDGFSKVVADVVGKDLEKRAEKATKAVPKVGRETAAELRATSPKKTGEYASGWRMRTENKVGQGATVRVYNARKPQLTHLLENGHEKRGGGFVGAIPHIQPAFKKAEGRLKEEMR